MEAFFQAQRSKRYFSLRARNWKQPEISVRDGGGNREIIVQTTQRTCMPPFKTIISNTEL